MPPAYEAVTRQSVTAVTEAADILSLRLRRGAGTAGELEEDLAYRNLRDRWSKAPSV